MNKNTKKLFLIKIFYPDSTYKYLSHFSNRFFRKTRTINWQIKPIKVYLKVVYCRDEDWKEKKEYFDNEGDFDNRPDFELALRAFLEEE